MPGRGRPPHPDILTPREWEVLALLRDGLSNEQTAERLGISFATAKFHVSEIIGKLGVSSREEAARWQPDGRGRPSRGALVAPWALVRRLHVGPAVGAGIVGLVAVAVALLAWGVLATRGDSGPQGWDFAGTTGSAHPSVMLFDIAKREARGVPVADSVMGARWLKPGETWLALQLDSTRTPTPPETNVTYRVYDVSGQGVWTVPPELTRAVIPAPDGNSVLIERIDNQYIISNLPTGNAATFLGSARDLSFSLDGRRVAYTTVGGSDEENVNHDWRSVTEGVKNDLTGYGGGGLAIQSQREADGLMDLPRDPWSPDSNYLLVERFTPCGTNSPDPGNCYGTPTFEVYGTQETGKVFWNAYAGRLQSAQWAGPGRLFVTFFPDAVDDPDFPQAQSLIVDLGLEKRPAPDVFQGACCASFSPDGRYAVVAHGGDAPHDERCSLVDAATGAELAGFDRGADDAVGIFCGAVSWTADGTQALVSSADGN
jgi:DNA-binding CsgD family transcriptional regulator